MATGVGLSARGDGYKLGIAIPEFEENKGERMQIQTTADQLIYTTTRLTAFSGGQSISTGTGFFFRFVFDVGPVDVLVTNKHVIAGADTVQLRMNMRDRAGAFLDEGHLISLSLQDVVDHPDPDVDLCAFGTGNITSMEHDGRRSFAISLSEANIPSDEEWQSFDSVEGVWMIGCPNGLYDTMNNLPIVRSGITASSPRLPYRGKQEFVVDMACFPGSSGSPIVQAPSISSLDRTTGGMNIGQPSKGHLLGVLYAGPLITNQGEIILSTKPRVEVASMMHLGYALRSSRILELKPIIEAMIGK